MSVESGAEQCAQLYLGRARILEETSIGDKKVREYFSVDGGEACSAIARVIKMDGYPQGVVRTFDRSNGNPLTGMCPRLADEAVRRSNS